jgi:hypothetical protein
MLETARWIALAFICSPLQAACSTADSTRAGRLQITVSAEGLGANGYAFPPSPGQDLAFVDGWAVNFDRIIVAVDNIRLSQVPDADPGDQGVTGATVVVRKGPFIVDLKQPGDFEDKGQAGKVAIRLPIDDLEDLFDLEQRYAFSYDLVGAASDATFVNIESDDSDVVAMVQAGQRALLTGRAEFRGQGCQSSGSYDFESLPKTVDFRFGLEGKVSYLNCQNPENRGKAIEGEESQRGVQLLPNGVTTAQITIHTDHLFWSSVNHENLPLFDQFAANTEWADGVHVMDLAMTRSVPVPRVMDSAGNALPWRSCVDSDLYVLPKQPPTMTFDPGSQALTNLYDFVQFNAATMGHLNADGLCYVARVAK